MNTVTAATLLLALGFPAVALWLVGHQRWAERLGTVVLCYAAGLLVGNSGLLPPESLPARTHLAEAAIALALPMILFTMDVRAWTRAAPRALWSMALAVASVVVVALASFLAIRLGTDLPRAHELAGLAVGVYTGGTPNLAAIKVALGIDDTRYLLFNAVDTFVTALYLLFMVTLGRSAFGRLLERTAPGNGSNAAAMHAGSGHDEDYRGLLTPRGLRGAGASLLLAAVVVATALGVAALLRGRGSAALVITLIATLGIAASFMAPVRRIPGSYQAGMYLIYVFSFTVASTASLQQFAGTDLVLPAFVAAIVFGSLVLHALLCRIARIDVDTFLVTSVAAICSPAFVPLMVRSLGNPSLLLSGITTGIIGYAIGTYLGIALALLLARFT